MVQAQWNKEIFGRTANSLRTLESFEISCGIVTEENESSNGVKKTVVKGFAAEELKISYNAGFAVGTDPRQEFEDFKKIAGMQDNFYLGNVNVGRTQFELDEVQLSDTQIGNSGRIFSGKISLSFTGDSNVSTKGSKSSKSSNKTAKKGGLSITQAEIDAMKARNSK
jgi:hypothetical protein